VTAVDATGTTASITFSCGRLTLVASPDALRLHLASPDEIKLDLLETLVTHRLEAIGRRDRLRPTWQRLTEPA